MMTTHLCPGSPYYPAPAPRTEQEARESCLYASISESNYLATKWQGVVSTTEEEE